LDLFIGLTFPPTNRPTVGPVDRVAYCINKTRWTDCNDTAISALRLLRVKPHPAAADALPSLFLPHVSAFPRAKMQLYSNRVQVSVCVWRNCCSSKRRENALSMQLKVLAY
jgi:hypothetical protein